MQSADSQRAAVTQQSSGRKQQHPPGSSPGDVTCHPLDPHLGMSSATAPTWILTWRCHLPQHPPDLPPGLSSVPALSCRPLQPLRSSPLLSALPGPKSPARPGRRGGPGTCPSLPGVPGCPCVSLAGVPAEGPCRGSLPGVPGCSEPLSRTSAPHSFK